MNKAILSGGLIATVALVAILASGFNNDPRRVRSPLLGQAAPSFDLDSFDGQRISLESLRGRPVVVNFWATWCEPCRLEHEVLRTAASALTDRVSFVGIAFDESRSRLAEFFKRKGASGYPTLLDEGGRTAIAYGLRGVPETFFIDSQGRLIARYEGPLDPPTTAMLLAKLLDHAPRPVAAESKSDPLGAPNGPGLQGDDLDRATERIASELRCPVCQGATIAESPNAMARDMKSQLRDLLARGFDEEQAIAYFERSFGEGIRVTPAMHGVAALLWAVPAFPFAFGFAAWGLSRRRRLGRRRDR